MRTVTNTVRKGNKGYFLVAFTDGCNLVDPLYVPRAFYDKSLDYVVTMLAKQCPKREVKEISWVEELQ